MAYEGLVDKPFGDMKGGNTAGRRAWFRKHRPTYKDQQVWRITSQGKHWLAELKASGREIMRFRRVRVTDNYDSLSEESSVIETEKVEQETLQVETTAFQNDTSSVDSISVPLTEEEVDFNSDLLTKEDEEVDEEDNDIQENHLLEIGLLNTIKQREERYTESRVFDPKDVEDARERTIGAIVRRRGQPEFRRKLLEVYKGRCAITGTDFAQALEAAHIIPYRGDYTNHISNGLLLRADLHALFDLLLIAIDTTSMTVILSPGLQTTTYAYLHGSSVFLPDESHGGPSRDALDQHRKASDL
ncbi:HNH endonuclease [Candidatus Oscillochloris fontis]|uniref:HNH endonuclease n=1 Tax=Candidatus Oscillochloris fontis TaxID=2496868 RepID=UPI001931160E|nr:HNH endonuclease [Candidatus Oscillochloris fontis]